MKRIKDVLLGWENDISNWETLDSTNLPSATGTFAISHDSDSPLSKTVLEVNDTATTAYFACKLTFPNSTLYNALFRISDKAMLAFDYKIEDDEIQYIEEIRFRPELAGTDHRSAKTISGAWATVNPYTDKTINGYGTMMIPLSGLRSTAGYDSTNGIVIEIHKNTAYVLSGIKLTSFRIVNQSNLIENQIDNQKLDNIVFDTTTIDSWTLSNLDSIEKNVINHPVHDTITIENTTGIQSKISQTYIATGGKYIQSNTRSFSLTVNCEKRNKVSLGILTDDGSFQGVKNVSLNEWEVLTCEFTGTKISSIFIYIESYSGLVTITNPLLQRTINDVIDNKQSFLNKGDYKNIYSLADTEGSYNQLVTYGQYTGFNRNLTTAYPMWVSTRVNPDAASSTAYLFFNMPKNLNNFKRIAVDFFVDKSKLDLTSPIEFYLTDSIKDKYFGEYIKTVRPIVDGINRISFSLHQCESDGASSTNFFQASMDFNVFIIKFNMVDNTTYLAEGDFLLYDIYPIAEKPFTVIADMQELGDWSKLSIGAGSISANKDDFVFGNQSISLLNNEVSTSSHYSLNLEHNIKSTELINLWLRTETGTFQTVAIYFISKRTGSEVAVAYIPYVNTEWSCFQVGVFAYTSAYYTELELYSSSTNDIDDIASIVISTINNPSYPDNTLHIGLISSESPREIVSFGGNKVTPNLSSDNGYYDYRVYNIQKTDTSIDYVEYLTDIGTTKINLLPYRDIYLPFKIPATFLSKISKVYMVIVNPSQTVKLGIEADLTGLVGDEYKLLKFSLKDLELLYELDTFYYINLNNIGAYGIRIVTNEVTDVFYAAKIEDFVFDNTDLNISGASMDYNDTIISEKLIGFMLNIPDEATLNNIESVNLSVNSFEDYRYTKFYKTPGKSLFVGWNQIFWDRDDYYLDTYNTSLGEPTNIADHINVSVVKYNYEINDNIEIKDLGLFNDPNFGHIRLSKINVIGSENYKLWEGRILKLGTITRKLSEKSGLLELPSSSIEFADTDEKIATVFSNIYGASSFLNNQINIKIGSAEDKESEYLNIYKGYINDIKFKQKKVTLSMSDTLEQYMIDLPRVILDGDLWTGIDDSEKGKQAATIYGQVESKVGALPVINAGCIPVIDEEVNEFHTQYYVVAGHPCKSGTLKVYFDGVEIASDDSRFAYSVDYDYVIGDEHFTVIAVPWIEQIDLSGENEWINPWKDDVTNKDALGEETPISTAPEIIAVSVHGKTVDGNPASDVLEDVVDVVYDVLVNEMGVPAARINTDNFAEIQTIVVQQNRIMAGAIVDNTSSEEVLAGMLLSHNISMFIDKNGLICLYSFRAQRSDAGSTLYTDEIDILSGSFTCDTGVKNLVNRIRYRCNFNYSDYYKDDEASWEARGTRQSDDSIARVGKPIDWEDEYLNLPWVRSIDKADSIAIILLQRFQNGRPGATLTLPLNGYVEDLGDKIKISHFDGVSLNRDSSIGVGWDSHLCVINSVQHNPDDMKVTLIVDNVQDLAVDCCFLGDKNTFSTLWADANTEERTYMYLADKTTGKMSDGVTDGHKLC